MFPRHKVTSASLPACLLLFVQKSTEGRAHWRQRWCHHCDHYCAVWCPIFDQASLRAGQNVCLHAARRNIGLPVLINTGPVFISPKTVLRPPPQAYLSLYSDAPQQMDLLSNLVLNLKRGPISPPYMCAFPAGKQATEINLKYQTGCLFALSNVKPYCFIYCLFVQ